MATGSRVGSERDGGVSRASRLPFDLPESKLERPAVRPGIIERAALLAMIEAAGPVPLIAVVAPAGYGKSMLLAQWGRGSGPRNAWISCDDGDNDPAVLLTCLAAAVAGVGAVDPERLRSIARGAGITTVLTLIEAIPPDFGPATVVLDQVESITNRECHDVLAEFVLRLPPGWQVAMASRHALPLPIPRLRLEGGVLEVGAKDLAMTDQEAMGLLAGAGVAHDERSAADLVHRTEGWPIGLYFAGLAMTMGADGKTGLNSSPTEGYVSEYLRSEIFEKTSDADMTFLTRTSILRRMDGPLCDATVGRTGSAHVLEQLERRNLLVVPLDHRREWYRYHHLFRELLQAELRRREPGIQPGLHSRAAAWFEANGLVGEAIQHAQAAGDTDRVARLVLDRMQPVWASGRVDTVLRWLTWIDSEAGIARYPGIAVHGALIFALLGRAEEAERWAKIAQQAPPDVVLPDGNTTRSLLAYLRAILATDGVQAMRRDARLSFAELAPSSPYRATMLYTEGISYLLEGDLDRADPILARAVDDAVGAGALPLAALVLAERCIVAADRDDWPRIDTFVDQALSIVAEGRFEDYWTSGLVYAWAARAALHASDMTAARRHAAHAARLRPLLVYSIPVVPTQTLLELARVYVGLGDAGGAEAALRQAEEILEERAGLGVLAAQAAQLRTNLDEIVGDAVGASSLTAAELRLVPLLATHLSLGQIGERLHIARATVKTQTTSIYRKLRVTSRGEAVSRSRELGLDLR